WDAKTYAELAQLKGHEGSVLSVAVMPDGARIVTGSADNTVRFWQLFPTGQALIEKAKILVQRCLTPAQRKLFYLAPAPPRWCITMARWPYEHSSSVSQGQRLVQGGEDDEAGVLFAEAISRDPTASGRVDAIWANAYLDRGKGLLGNSRDDEAKVLF